MRYGIAAGVAWGASLLTRGTLLGFPFSLPVGVALSRTHRRHWLRWIIPFFIAATVVVAPWVARNYPLTGSFVPVSTWGWPAIYSGTQVAKRMWDWVDLGGEDAAAREHIQTMFLQQSRNEDLSNAGATREVRYDQFAKALTLADWSSDRIGVAERAAMGLGYTWFFAFGAKLRLLSLAIHLPLFVLFVLGAVTMARQYREAFVRAWPALGLILYVNVFHAVAYPHVRYMAPAIALSFLFSGLPLVSFVHRFMARRP
jgi:hypothetical protein